MARAVTLEEVGARAGVSRSTVSRVINGSPDASPKAVAAVMEAVTELGYVPNRSAQALASRKAAVVTALIPEDMERFFGDPFFGAIISGIEDGIRSTSLVLNLVVTSEASSDKILSFLVGGQSDGILVLSHHTSHRLIEAVERRIPVVYGGKPIGNPEEKNYVDVDNCEGGRMAARHLLAKGRRQLAMIAGPSDMPSAQERRAGFLELAGSAVIEAGDYSAASGAEAARRLLDAGGPVDGVFVANDLMARAAVDVFQASGRRVPEDIAVVGFDDSVAATVARPHLTTIRQDPFAQGQTMVQLLLSRLEGNEPARSVLLPLTLVERESA
ncbi:LacI family DNA-binding transcriptional regulator [Scrofimicrobium sp. R131]|uniref:LacI family DNA-binding transcriptional regulator n=1 Tax=Scrofimicrobium appendicitidis TaxID=3079930 RepID=A0AAU7V5F1_9ACTO